MQIFGAGVGRTGTLSLRRALEQLGFGPCHHMQVVLKDRTHHVPLWNAALDGQPDWSSVYEGMRSAVDWPTASFYRELAGAFPEAKFILTYRDPSSWADSFGDTIYTAIAGLDQAPPEARPWLDMCVRVIARAGFPLGLDKDQLAERFVAHNQAVIETIPAARLLEFQVKEGWEPVCRFLGTDVPQGDFPRSNDRAEFWEIVEEGTRED